MDELMKELMKEMKDVSSDMKTQVKFSKRELLLGSAAIFMSGMVIGLLAAMPKATGKCCCKEKANECIDCCEE